jgi:hypothetical protein
MRGVITIREVLLNPVTIVNEFGFALFFRCVVAAVSGRRCTFLELVFA